MKLLRQKQKKHGGKDGGEAELAYPHEQREELQISTSPTSSFGYYYSDIRRKKQDFFVEFFKGRRFYVRLFALCSQKICLSSSQLPESIVKSARACLHSMQKAAQEITDNPKPPVGFNDHS